MANGYYEDGTIALANGAATVTGVGTAFITRVRVGDKFTRDGYSIPIIGPTTDGVAITSNTSLTLAWNWPGTTLTAGSTYKIETLPDLTRSLQAAEALLAQMGNGTLLSLSGLDGTGGDKVPYFTGANTLVTAALNALGRTLIGSDAATIRPALDVAQKQSSAIDTTGGRGLIVGAFGIGGLGGAMTLFGNDYNLAVNVSGIFSGAGASAINGPPGSTAYGPLLVKTRGLQVTQIAEYFSAAGIYQMAVRGSVDGGSTWTPWVYEYNQANILGTVSQTGGVPTGALFQYGSNANGDFVRIADGTQICSRYWRPNETTSASSVTGIFQSTNSFGWVFPAAFAAMPTSVQLTAERIDRVVLGVGGGLSSSTQITNCRATHLGTALGLGFHPDVSGLAIGRWY